MSKWRVTTCEPVVCADGTARGVFVGLYPDYLTVGEFYTEKEFEAEFGLPVEDGYEITQ